MESDVVLRFTQEQGLVLFDAVARLNESESFTVMDPAEQRVFWFLEASLEAEVDAVVSPNYAHLLAAARRNLGDWEA